MSSPSSTYTSGDVRLVPLFAPTWSSSNIGGAPGKRWPTTPFVARYTTVWPFIIRFSTGHMRSAARRCRSIAPRRVARAAAGGGRPGPAAEARPALLGRRDRVVRADHVGRVVASLHRSQAIVVRAREHLTRVRGRLGEVHVRPVGGA